MSFFERDLRKAVERGLIKQRVVFRRVKREPARLWDLVKLLDDENELIKENVASVLNMLGSDLEYHQLIWSKRKADAKALLDKLASLLDHTSWMVRASTALAFGSWWDGDTSNKAIERIIELKLLKLLDDESEIVRSSAAGALIPMIDRSLLPEHIYSIKKELTELFNIPLARISVSTIIVKLFEKRNFYKFSEEEKNHLINKLIEILKESTYSDINVRYLTQSRIADAIYKIATYGLFNRDLALSAEVELAKIAQSPIPEVSNPARKALEYIQRRYLNKGPPPTMWY